MSMKREDIIEHLLRDREAEFRNRDEAEKALDVVLESITKGLRRRPRTVTITNFGTFRVVRRKARKGINPNTGEELEVPSSATVKFRAGEHLKKRL